MRTLTSDPHSKIFLTSIFYLDNSVEFTSPFA